MLCVAGCAGGDPSRTAPSTALAPSPDRPRSAPAVDRAAAGPCDQPAAFIAASLYNGAAEANLEFSPFGRAEKGWGLYVPQLTRSLATRCAPETPAFAAAVARYQEASGLPPTGALTPETFLKLKTAWQERRAFYRLRLQGVCPEGAVQSDLVPLNAAETLGGKTVYLDAGAAQALRAMVAAARAELGPQAGQDLLAPFSGYRSPASDAERCRLQGDCQGVVRAECSAHRTGRAVDLNLGEAPGYPADSTADPNRLHQTQSKAYAWLVRNAERFGFVNYVFEPWHWEWIGPPP